MMGFPQKKSGKCSLPIINSVCSAADGLIKMGKFKIECRERPFSHVDYRCLDKDGNIVGLNYSQAACFADMTGLMKKARDVGDPTHIHFQLRHDLHTDADLLYFDFIRNVWHMPEILTTVEDFNEHGITIDIHKYNAFEVFVAMSLCRYPQEFGEQWTNKFKRVHDRWPQLPALHHFIITHFYGIGNCNHQFFTYPVPNVCLDDVTPETIRSHWPKYQESCFQNADYRRKCPVNGGYGVSSRFDGAIVKSGAEFGWASRASDGWSEKYDMAKLYPRTYDKRFPLLNKAV